MHVGKEGFIIELQKLHLIWNANSLKKELVVVSRRFRKIGKSDYSFVMSVHPSVRMEKLGSHWTDFREI